ncbi:MAG TPA: alpha-amylase/4-alpha-glucanotransferase domain-containing protein [Ktedonobacteraceae bacterium]|nr:alpha-amylase/4-alpha-glucanotransferase domain-containing protein [Ktedonobacteraceae bacterium]
MTTVQRSSIHIGLVLHNHQPVGNFPWVFQQVYDEAYLPLIEALERHPGVRLSLHYTGSLLDWMQEAQPDFLKRIAALVQRKQVEILSGGYYEPILPAIPDDDKLAQIHRLTQRVASDFGAQASGMWIAERVWEPGLPRILREAGIEWTILDDSHLKGAGLDDSDLFGYYATEDQGSVLKVFATSKTLRYTIPWRPASETIQAMRDLATPDGKRIVVMGDDGEKFGSWPGTQEHCWGPNRQGGWIDDFFSQLEMNSNWLHCTPLGEYARDYPALGRVYIPTSSYNEMNEWALPAKKSYAFGKLLHTLEEEHRDDILQFMRGGFWRNFMVRYSEVNNQHKKMLRAHKAVYKAGASAEAGVVDLWKAQANDTYWHGLFGGIYMNHVRSAIYHYLIKAENAADALNMGTDPWQRYEFTDFDCDSQDELLVEGDRQNLYIDAQRGGTLFEWDMRRSMHNLLCVMTRREEGYHQTLRDFEQERRRQQNGQPDEASGTNSEVASPHTTVATKEAGLDRYIVVDRYRRYSLVDHFFDAGTNLTSFAQGQFEEYGNFVEQPYAVGVQQHADGLTVALQRDGQIRRPGALGPLPVHVTKTLFIPPGEEELSVHYLIENKGATRLQTRFGCEWNFNLLGGGSNGQAYYRVDGRDLENGHFDSTGEVTEVSSFHIGNQWIQQDIAFSLSEAATLWRFSIDIVSGSEAGFERTHQGSSLTLLWPLVLEAGQTWQVEIQCKGQS